MDEIALVGGVLNDTPDPLAASEILAQLLLAQELDPGHIRELGFEPALVRTLRRALPRDPDVVALACARGAAWVLGRRSNIRDDSWQLVVSLPNDIQLPQGIRRATAETLIGLIAEAKHLLRFAAPYIDSDGMGMFVDAIAAATLRGVTVEVVRPTHWPPGIAAIALLREGVDQFGDSGCLRIVTAKSDAPWAHLKVVVMDASAAYIGSANITGAGLAGRNLELGVLVRGSQVATIDKILNIYTEP